MAQSKEDYIKDKGDKGDEVSFTLVNEDAVKRLKEDGVIKVPEKKISVPKDMRWNEKQMASKILQGIQNGDSVNKISKSLESVVDNNRVSAMRNARTMTTAAENRGRFDSYRKLDEQGVVQKKVWIATPDDRVRASHLDIDGEEQEINAPFSNGCQFPADGNGPAEEVWNCRCSMKDYIVGFRRKDGTVSYVEGGPDKTMHSEQIAAKKAERQAATAVKKSAAVVNGKDISATWTRRADKFDFEIEDAINAQGFDGKPRVVSPEEFERYVEEANDGKGFIAQRTYAAPDQETLDDYRNQLYNGKWYVDCSIGGSQYGQGMYCAADYNGKLNQGISIEMEHYRNLNIGKCLDSISEEDKNRILELRAELEKIDVDKYGDPYKLFIANNSDIIKERLDIDVPVAYTETMTLDKSAKIINYDDLVKMKDNESQKWEDVFWNSGDVKGMDMRDKINSMDIGSYAVIKGYDVINAEGHGESGSYTVILNRTKLIIKEDK